jgi:hypothetical protein
MPHRALATLKSISPYSQSRYHATEHLERESHDDYEKRTWRERLHVNKDGHVFIPPMSFKNSLSEGAKYLSMKVPSGGKATYTKHFEAGILVMDPLVLPIKKTDVTFDALFVPSDGRRGGGSRVMKQFPLIPEWRGTVLYHVLDDTITEPVFKKHLRETGNFIGIGRFRPRNNGYYGRFTIEKLEWSEVPDEE